VAVNASRISADNVTLADGNESITQAAVKIRREETGSRKISHTAASPSARKFFTGMRQRDQAISKKKTEFPARTVCSSLYLRAI
jgi:hypothetical protein